MNARVLVLNASFEPINVCTERRAVVMIFKGVARMEEHNGHMLHSERLALHAPSVIRLTEYRHIPFERRSLSRKNILLRDREAENRRGIIWLRAASAAIIVRVIARRKNQTCGCCAGLVGFRCT